MVRNLKDYEKRLLEEGNSYTLGSLLLELYPEEMEAEGYDLKKHVNHYRGYIEWDPAGKIFTFIGKKGKYFFNTEAKLVGVKDW